MAKISLMVGHKIEAQGADSVAPLQMTEYAFNTEFAKGLAAVLSKDHDVKIFFRDGLSITSAYRAVDKWGPAISMELHFNSADTPAAYGTETLCVSRSRVFAKIVQDAMCKALGRDVNGGDRGVKILEPDDRGYTSVTQLQCPNILVEPFFGSSEKDCALIMANIGKLCSGIEVAINHYLSLT